MYGHEAAVEAYSRLAGRWWVTRSDRVQVLGSPPRLRAGVGRGVCAAAAAAAVAAAVVSTKACGPLLLAEAAIVAPPVTLTVYFAPFAFRATVLLDGLSVEECHPS